MMGFSVGRLYRLSAGVSCRTSAAAKIMVKMGFKEGRGLGKEGQGMSTALQVERTSRRGGKIIHEKDLLQQTAMRVQSFIPERSSNVSR